MWERESYGRAEAARESAFWHGLIAGLIVGLVIGITIGA